MDTPKQVLKKWVQFMNEGNADGLAELYHDDAINLQIAVGKPLVGKAAIHRDFAEFFAAIPDNFTHEVNLLEDGDWGIVEWSGGGTYKPNGKRFALKGCGFFQIVDGKIKLQRGYWDKATLFAQMGVPFE